VKLIEIRLRLGFIRVLVIQDPGEIGTRAILATYEVATA